MTGNFDPELLNETACSLTANIVMSGELRPPRNIITVGLRGCFGHSDAIMELAQALNAPVLTRLHAKGAVDESHPLAFGVIGVHGKPGLECAATLISSCDRVVSIGVDDESLLICNLAGLQVRQVIEIEPDALCVSMRFNAEHTITGNITDICKELARLVEARNAKLGSDETDLAAVDAPESPFRSDLRMEEIADFMGPMVHNNPEAFIITSPGHRRRISAPVFEEKGAMSFLQDSYRLWDIFHSGDVRMFE